MGNCNSARQDKLINWQNRAVYNKVDYDPINPFSTNENGRGYISIYHNITYHIKKILVGYNSHFHMEDQVDIVEKLYQSKFAKVGESENIEFSPCYIILIQEMDLLRSKESFGALLTELLRIFHYLIKNNLMEKLHNNKKVYLFLIKNIYEEDNPPQKNDVLFELKNILEDKDYLAPETFSENYSKIQNNYIAHIFSIGLMLVQLSGMSDIQGLNKPGAGEFIDRALLFLIHKWKDDNISKLFKMMLHHESTRRPDLLDFIFILLKDKQLYLHKVNTLFKSTLHYDHVYQYQLARFYTLAEKRDFEKIFEWLKKSSDQGNIEAQFKLGLCYHYGWGIPKNPEIAFTLFNLIQIFHLDARALVGFYIVQGISVNEDIIHGMKILNEAASEGSAPALYLIGIIYASELAGPADLEKSKEYLQKAVELDFAPAFNSLGLIELDQKNPDKALEWFLKGACKCDGEACTNIGNYYYDIKQDYKRAMQFYEMALINGDNAALSRIGYFYLNGIEVIKDSAKALAKFHDAASKGEPSGYYELGNFYLLKEGKTNENTEIDNKKAINYYEKAARLLYQPAIIALEKLYAIDGNQNTNYPYWCRKLGHKLKSDIKN